MIWLTEARVLPHVIAFSEPRQRWAMYVFIWAGRENPIPPKLSSQNVYYYYLCLQFFLHFNISAIPLRKTRPSRSGRRCEL